MKKQTNVNETSITTTINGFDVANINPNLLTVATAKVSQTDIPKGSVVHEKMIQYQILNELDNTTALERCRVAYELRNACTQTSTKFKYVCQSMNWNDSNALKDAKSYETILLNDELKELFQFASVTILRVCCNCKNFQELKKAIENGVITLPTIENNFKGSTIAEIKDVVSAINAGVVNISPANMPKEEEQATEEQATEEQATEEQATEEQTTGVTLEQLINLYNNASDEVKEQFKEYLTK